MPKNEKAGKALAKLKQDTNGGIRRLDGAVVQVDAVYDVAELKPGASGPWSVEPDKIAWMDQGSGYPCIIRRSPRGGHLAGFVAVPPSHPMYGYSATALIGVGLTTHGRIDYAAPCDRSAPETISICHVSHQFEWHEVAANREAAHGTDQPHGDDAWWFGFECDGPDDVVPAGSRARPGPDLADGVNDPTYKTVDFVYAETIQLAAQLRAIGEGRDPAEAVVSDGRQGHQPGAISWRRPW